MMNISELRPGVRVYRWISTGNNHTPTGQVTASDIQELTVIRVNRKTVTVQIGTICFRLPIHDGLVGEMRRYLLVKIIPK